MNKKNKTVTNKEGFESAPIVAFSNFYTTENGISAKSWYPQDEQNISSDQWLQNDINIVFYSTGLCKLSFSLSEEDSYYSWGIKFLDQNEKMLKTINFAPLFIDFSKKKKKRQVKLEHRLPEKDQFMIDEVKYVQLVNFSANKTS